MEQLGEVVEYHVDGEADGWYEEVYPDNIDDLEHHLDTHTTPYYIFKDEETGQLFVRVFVPGTTQATYVPYLVRAFMSN